MGDIEAAHMPAEASYYTAGALIDGFPYTKLDLGAGVQAARFGSTTMLWRTDPGGAVSLDLATGKRWVIVNVVGSATPLAVAANGKAAVSVTDSPVYVLTADDYARLTAY
jgi:hypothetical protein